MKRIHLAIGALLWIGAWFTLTLLRDAHAPAPGTRTADAPRGERIAHGCRACHSLDDTQPNVGPHLLDVVGRRAGSVAGYTYSDALRASELVWTRERLRAFLMNPEAVVPGTTMALGGWPEAEVDAVVDYLAASQR